MFFFLIFTFTLLIIGFYGMFLVRKHIIIILISLEILLLASNINFIFFSVYLDDLLGQLYMLFILTIAAAETALGLAFMVIFFRLRGGISLDLLTLLKS